MDFAPRLIRLRDCARYCGMDPNRFNAEVRPYLTEVPIGVQGVAFDRVEIDRWIDDYIARNGRPGKGMKGGMSWGRRSRPDLSNVVTRGTSKRESEIREFEKALARATSRKQNDI